MKTKPLNLKIIQENKHHECNGKCTGKNGKDGYCYHDDGTKHKAGICKANHSKSLNENC
tara:strand:+ start:343 stop:519 length:177 start_codon:yes stop_codon:yes gene_type:complete